MKYYSLVPLLFQKLIWIPTRLTLIIFGHLKVEGLEHLQGIATPILFSANHSSEIDPFMVPASLPFFSRFSPLFYAVREKTFYDSNGWRKHLFNGWFINMWGGYSAQVGLRDYEKSLVSHIAILRDGKSFCIFPEGGITHDQNPRNPTSGKVQSAKGGISFLAHSGTCTIVPVAISGVYGMSPSDFFLRKRKIIVRFGQPITPANLYNRIEQPHTPSENVWKREADYIMSKVAEMLS